MIFHWITQLSSPPDENKYESSFPNRTFVMCDECPLPSTN